jgi:hypothetical protein
MEGIPVFIFVYKDHAVVGFYNYFTKEICILDPQNDSIYEFNPEGLEWIILRGFMR